MYVGYYIQASTEFFSPLAHFSLIEWMNFPSYCNFCTFCLFGCFDKTFKQLKDIRQLSSFIKLSNLINPYLSWVSNNPQSITILNNFNELSASECSEFQTYSATQSFIRIKWSLFHCNRYSLFHIFRTFRNSLIWIYNFLIFFQKLSISWISLFFDLSVFFLS